MLATKSQELDKILSAYPRIKQTDAIENAEFVRFTLELFINQADHLNPPRIFLLFTQNEFRDATMRGSLELELSKKIERTSFKDGANGREIRTSLRKEADSIWCAVTVDGSIWKFDEGQSCWIKQPISL